MSKKKILAIFGHPDDAEQFAGETLILLQRAGHAITIAALTDGACGAKEKTPEDIIAIRRKESEKAAQLIGPTFINLGIRDGSIEYSFENTKKIVALLREAQPDIIFTHPAREDYMTDHWHTGALVLWAVPEAGHANFKSPTKAPALKIQPYVYHTDPQGLTFSDGQIAHVNTVVDISDVIEEKLNAFAAHSSQLGFLSKKDTPNAVVKTRRWAIARGEQIRVEYAEGFRQQLLAEYPRDNILFRLLPGKVYTL